MTATRSELQLSMIARVQEDVLRATAWTPGALPCIREIAGSISRQHLPHVSRQRERHESPHESDQDAEPAREIHRYEQPVTERSKR
jgi:hypothetical protein